MRALRQVGDLTLFQRYLRVLAAPSGQLLNLSDIGRDLGVAVSTVKAWLSVLEATYQVFVLRPYFSKIGKRLVKTPKVYVADTGLLCALVGLKSVSHAASGHGRGDLRNGRHHRSAQNVNSSWRRAPAPFLANSARRGSGSGGRHSDRVDSGRDQAGCHPESRNGKRHPGFPGCTRAESSNGVGGSSWSYPTAPGAGRDGLAFFRAMDGQLDYSLQVPILSRDKVK